MTGAASGIGRATAELFARSGARVVIADQDRRAAAETAAAVVSAGGAALAVGVDVSDAAQVEDAVQRTMTEYGGIDVLVNNAGIGVAGDVVSTGPEDLDRVLAVNVRGVFNGCRAAIPRMLGRGGIIVNVASAAALSAVPERAAYIASKGAVIALTKAIAVDFMARGIR
ncbi:hypothetical protein BH18CHL2_BH18CHL2_12630 [soil metagenome]